MSNSGESTRKIKIKIKIRGVKLALLGAGALVGAITALGLRQFDIDQLNPHPRLGI